MLVSATKVEPPKKKRKVTASKASKTTPSSQLETIRDDGRNINEKIEALCEALEKSNIGSDSSSSEEEVKRTKLLERVQEAQKELLYRVEDYTDFEREAKQRS